MAVLSILMVPMFVIYFDFLTVFYQATKKSCLIQKCLSHIWSTKLNLVYRYMYLIFFNVMSKFDLCIRYSNSQQVFKKSSWRIKCRLYNIKIKISLQEIRNDLPPNNYWWNQANYIDLVYIFITVKVKSCFYKNTHFVILFYFDNKKLKFLTTT